MKRFFNITRRPWGKFVDFAEKKGKWHLKAIVVKKGHRLSLQRHQFRSELWIVAEGKIRVQKGRRNFVLKPCQTIFIRKQEKHRIEALTNAVVIEVTFGTHREKDIERLSDDYGRSK